MREKTKIAFCTAIFLVFFTSLFTGEVAIIDQQPDAFETILPRSAAEDPSLIFFEDFLYSIGGGYTPTGWTSNNAANLRFYVLQGGYDAFTTDCLMLNDDLAGSLTWGYRNFASSVTSGTFEFEFCMANSTSYGSELKEFHLKLRDASGVTSIITWSIFYTDSTQVITVSLQGTAGSKLYLTNQIYDVKIAFANNLLDMYVDGTLELSGVTYVSQAIQQIYMESTSAMHGAAIYFDNFEIRSSSPVPEPTLNDISPAIDTDTTIDLDWSDVNLATYKVFRDRKEIYNATGLTPIATPSTSNYQDTVPEQGTYWYAIVATNASGDSAPSISKSVRVDLGMPALTWNPPVLASISPNPDSDGMINLNWEMPGWPVKYNATDQFLGGTIDPWTIGSVNPNTAATVEQNIGPFAKAIKLIDNNTKKGIQISRTFTAQATGSIEFWVYPTRTDRFLGFYGREGPGNVGPSLGFFGDGNVYAKDGLYNSGPLMGYTSYCSYRVRIDYNSATDRASYYINDTLLASNLLYYHSSFGVGDINKIEFYTSEAETGQEVYVTYPGITGQGSYDVGDNAYGVANVTNYKVYRNTSEITDVSGLSPIATVTENSYTNQVIASGTYWYAIVAVNGTDSPVSNSESVVVDISDVYENDKIFTLDPGAHQVTIVDTDGTTILMEFSINVLTTMEMKVLVVNANPTSVNLLHALRFFIIDVYSGTYAQSMQVKFHYKDAGLKAEEEAALSVFHLGPTAWDKLGGAVYESENCVLVTLDHFSSYAVAWTEGEFKLPEFMIWIIAIGAGFIIIMAIFKFRGKKGGSGKSPDAFEDLFDNFD